MLFSPGTVIANDLPPQEAAKPETTVIPTPETSATPAAPAQVPVPGIDAKALMEAINADRVQREKTASDAKERDTYKARADAAEAKLNDLDKAKKNRLLDPAGFLRKMGYSDRDLALTSEGIMFTLMPDKAPPGWVANLVKAQREQDLSDAEERDKQRETDAQKRASESHVAQEKEIEKRYQNFLEQEVAAFPAGTYKASQIWFADNHKAYAQELFDTARALADEAVKAGKTIDVSGSAIAVHVEKKYAEKAQRLAAAFSASQLPTTQPQKPVQAPSQPEEKSETPVIAKATSKGMTDKEIIERATRAAFGRM